MKTTTIWRALPIALLGLCGLALALLLHVGFAGRYSLAEYGGRARQSIATLTDFSNEAAYWYLGSMIGLFGIYALGVWLLGSLSAQWGAARRRAALVLIIGGGALFCVVLLPMYPVDASDIYDYIIRGRMSAVYDMNPMANVPQQIQTDPLFRFVSWRRTPSAYGPAWELVAHGVSALTADASINAQVVAYKGIAIAGYGLTALFIGLTLRRIAPRRLLVGLFIFMWNPLVVYMTAGRGHHDALMTAAVALALYCLSRRLYLAATLGAGVGVLIKFIPALLLPIIVLVALRDLGLRRWLRYLLLAALIGGALTVALYAPYWHGLDTLRTSRRAFMLTGSVAAVARQWLMPILDGITDLSTPARDTPNSTALIANGTLILFGMVYLAALLSLWRSRDPLLPYRTAARVILAYLLIASIWFHGWYVIWLLALVALLEDTPLRRLALVFSYLVTWQAFLYNTMLIQPRGGSFLPWLDLVPVTIYMGYAWVFLGWYGARLWVWRWMRDEHTRRDGALLQSHRQDRGLSLSDLSDELGIPYDHLVHYEAGLRSPSLAHARALAQRLDVPLAALVGTKA